MAEYFSHDSNARNDSKMVALRMKHGAEGYGVFWMIIERLRDEKDYMSAKDYSLLAFDIRVDTQVIKSVVEDFDLFQFSEDGQFFFSNSLMNRMKIMEEASNKRSNAARKAAQKRWVAGGNAPDSPSNEDAQPMDSEGNADENAKAMRTHSEGSTSDNANAMQNKRKEIKRNKTKLNNNISPPTPSASQLQADFDKLWDLYPKKERKQDAYKAYCKAVKEGVTNKKIQDGIIAYKAKLQAEGTDYNYVAQGGTWFNQQRWNDEYVIAPKKPQVTKSQGHRPDIVPSFLKEPTSEQPVVEEQEADDETEKELRARLDELLGNE